MAYKAEMDSPGLSKPCGFAKVGEGMTDTDCCDYFRPGLTVSGVSYCRT
jgi:hypothetical protein